MSIQPDKNYRLRRNARLLFFHTSLSLFNIRETNIQARTIFSSFSKCRTAGRHAGDHHGSPFPNRVLSVDTS